MIFNSKNWPEYRIIQHSAKPNLIVYSGLSQVICNKTILPNLLKCYPYANIIGFSEHANHLIDDEIDVQAYTMDIKNIRFLTIHKTCEDNPSYISQKILDFLVTPKIKKLCVIADKRDFNCFEFKMLFNEDLQDIEIYSNQNFQDDLDTHYNESFVGCNFMPQSHHVVIIGFYTNNIPKNFLFHRI